MNIGITCYPSAGGSGIVATELGLKLAERGHQVHFISSEAPFRLNTYVENVFYHPIQATSYPLFKSPPYTLPLAVKMVDVAKHYKLDVMHVHYAIPHATSAYLAKQILNKEGVAPKIITTLHGTDITLVGLDQSFYDIVRFSIEESDGVTAVSNYLAGETSREFKIKRKIETIYNFIDNDRFSASREKCTRGQFANEGEFLIAHVSNFRPVKRVPDVIEIFDRIQRELPAKLLLVGEGPDSTLVRRLARKKGLEDSVQFMGTQVSVETLLPNADLFLLPSQEESFGLSALEAMACGAPVIGSLGSGISEVTEDGVTGMLHQVGDTASMANSAIELLKDKARHRAFRENSLTRAREKFCSHDIVAQYEKYYETVLAGAPSPVTV